MIVGAPSANAAKVIGTVYVTNAPLSMLYSVFFTPLIVSEAEIIISVFPAM